MHPFLRVFCVCDTRPFHTKKRKYKPVGSHITEKGEPRKGGAHKLKKESEKKGRGNKGNQGKESRRWENNRQSLNISSKIIYGSTLWQCHPSETNQTPGFSIMEAWRQRRCVV